jgi:hypothetical protein
MRLEPLSTTLAGSTTTTAVGVLLLVGLSIASFELEAWPTTHPVSAWLIGLVATIALFGFARRANRQDSRITNLSLGVLWLSALVRIVARGHDHGAYAPPEDDLHFAWFGVTIVALLTLVQTILVWWPLRSAGQPPALLKASIALAVAGGMNTVLYAIFGTELPSFVYVLWIHAWVLGGFTALVWCWALVGRLTPRLLAMSGDGV